MAIKMNDIGAQAVVDTLRAQRDDALDACAYLNSVLVQKQSEIDRLNADINGLLEKQMVVEPAVPDTNPVTE